MNDFHSDVRLEHASVRPDEQNLLLCNAYHETLLAVWGSHDNKKEREKKRTIPTLQNETTTLLDVCELSLCQCDTVSLCTVPISQRIVPEGNPALEEAPSPKRLQHRGRQLSN